jgi:hypothetical protein
MAIITNSARFSGAALRRRLQEGVCSATFRRSHLVALPGAMAETANHTPFPKSFADEPEFHKVSE